MVVHEGSPALLQILPLPGARHLNFPPEVREVAGMILCLISILGAVPCRRVKTQRGRRHGGAETGEKGQEELEGVRRDGEGQGVRGINGMVTRVSGARREATYLIH